MASVRAQEQQPDAMPEREQQPDAVPEREPVCIQPGYPSHGCQRSTYATPGPEQTDAEQGLQLDVGPERVPPSAVQEPLPDAGPERVPQNAEQGQQPDVVPERGPRNAALEQDAEPEPQPDVGPERVPRNAVLGHGEAAEPGEELVRNGAEAAYTGADGVESGGADTSGNCARKSRGAPSQTSKNPIPIRHTKCQATRRYYTGHRWYSHRHAHNRRHGGCTPAHRHIRYGSAGR
jgi:hypothetical protein